ncbi:MAG: hypothetical protein ACQERZ_08295 [Fusobacteriota bacterium]
MKYTHIPIKKQFRFLKEYNSLKLKMIDIWFEDFPTNISNVNKNKKLKITKKNLKEITLDNFE